MNKKYYENLLNLKNEIRKTQKDITLNANSKLLHLYYKIGRMINENKRYGNNFIENLSTDLKLEFPLLKGFSTRNLYYMKRLYEAYDEEFVIKVLSGICWTNNQLLLSKIQNDEERKWYAIQAVRNSWSEGVILNQIGTRLYDRQAINENKTANYIETLEEPQNENVLNILKDPYFFDFISNSNNMKEKDFEDSLTSNITKLLMELGKGFTFVGRQYHIELEDNDYFIDLLFYNLDLRCYVVIELKTTKFIPEYIGKISFYVSAVDRILKKEQDNPTIGILLCKDKGKLTAEITLKDINKPLGVAEYKFLEEIPEWLNKNIPDIKIIEEKLNSLDDNNN